MRPMECQACGLVIRMSYQWIARLDGAPACLVPGCTGQLEPPCLEDLLAMDPDEARRHPAYAKCVMGYTIDATIKAARRGHYADPVRCVKCPRFIRHKGALCDCGWQNDARGGGYYAAAGRANDNVAIPF